MRPPGITLYRGPQSRYCVQHREQAPIEGGDYVISEDGKRRYWLCARCLKRHNEKRFAKTTVRINIPPQDAGPV